MHRPVLVRSAFVCGLISQLVACGPSPGLAENDLANGPPGHDESTATQRMMAQPEKKPAPDLAAEAIRRSYTKSRSGQTEELVPSADQGPVTGQR
jgi:hypothetical protein